MSASTVHLESWVKQQYGEIGWGRDGNSPFIGKKALKQHLINRHPGHKRSIRQLINALSHTESPRRIFYRTQVTVAQSPAPPSSAPQAPAIPTPKPKLAPLPTSESEVSSPTATGPDSGFASGVDENSPERDISMPFIASTIGIKNAYAKSEDGGATLKALPLKVSTSGKEVKKVESILQTTSNPKILELQRFLAELKDAGRKDDESGPEDKADNALSMLDLQMGLLHSAVEEDESSTSGLRNAVIFSGEILNDPTQQDLPQYGLLGSADPNSSAVADSRLFLNTNIPFSAFLCGVQGSGKSHTTACMVENCLIPTPVLGVLQNPLSALVFNFAEYTANASFRPCELAFLASPGLQFPNNPGVKKVNVLVSPSNFLSLKAAYTQIPNVTVQPFMLHPKDLNISTILTLMSVSQTQAEPLYMGIVRKILRAMATESTDSFNYPEFRRRLYDAGLDKRQEEFLNQRLDLLESFLDLDGSTPSTVFPAGEITIIDLSCPFVDPSTACVLFKIGMGLYLESDPNVGKLIVLDEAHKYMTDTPASEALTASLMGVIRQQRHYGARIIISTQEPSISPRLIDLCSLTIMHRFSSPEWLDVLRRHILVSDTGAESEGANKVRLLREIMRLKTGEALVFAPSKWVGDGGERGDGVSGDRDADGNGNGNGNGRGDLVRMRMRKRVTWDGGRSVVCV